MREPELDQGLKQADGRTTRPAIGGSAAANTHSLAIALACTLGLVAAGCSRESSPPAATTHATSAASAPEAGGDAQKASNALRICGDPGNMPLSNKAGEGFQNKIAEVLGKSLGMPVEYFWHTYYERGLARGTINADHCDVLMDMTSDFEMGLTTKPFYRSTYVLIGRKGLALDPQSLDDPELKTLRIGVFQSSPARQALHDHGVVGVVQYLFYDSASQPQDHPGKLVQDVASGKLDAAESWGPIAGYYAKRDGLTMRPINLLDDEVLEYSVALATSRKNKALRDKLDVALVQNRDAIRKILDEYSVPLVKCEDCVISGDLPSHGPYPDRTTGPYQPSGSPQALADLKTRLQAGAAPNEELEAAVAALDPDRIAYLIGHGGDPDALLSQGENALHLAIRNQQPELVEQLLAGGAKVEGVNKDGWTPLMIAVWVDQPDAVAQLLARKANVNAVAKDGWTPLTVAITYGDGAMVRTLVEAGADANGANESGFTPVMFAITKNQPDVLEALVKRGADVNRANKAGITPLMMAAAGGQDALAMRLLDAGAKSTPKDADGRTAADIARQSGHAALADSLAGQAGKR